MKCRKCRTRVRVKNRFDFPLYSFLFLVPPFHYARAYDKPDID